MALTRCKDCGGQVSTRARSCPHCGRPRGAPIIAVVYGLMIAFILGMTFYYRQFLEGLF